MIALVPCYFRKLYLLRAVRKAGCAYLCAMNSQKNIRHLSLDELVAYFEQMGEKKFRAKQVYEWLWKKHAHSFEAMTNLSKELRTKPGRTFYSTCPTG